MIDLPKYHCVTMPRDEILVFLVTYAHWPVQPFRDSSCAVQGRFPRHD
jgi:hypothetical protein